MINIALISALSFFLAAVMNTYLFETISLLSQEFSSSIGTAVSGPSLMLIFVFIGLFMILMNSIFAYSAIRSIENKHNLKKPLFAFLKKQRLF